MVASSVPSFIVSFTQRKARNESRYADNLAPNVQQMSNKSVVFKRIEGKIFNKNLDGQVLLLYIMYNKGGAGGIFSKKRSLFCPSARIRLKESRSEKAAKIALRDSAP